MCCWECSLYSPSGHPCSAGVGRTGTFITLHAQLRRIRTEDNLDVFGFVRSMRYQRCFMVQTEVCVAFLYRKLRYRYVTVYNHIGDRPMPIKVFFSGINRSLCNLYTSFNCIDYRAELLSSFLPSTISPLMYLPFLSVHHSSLSLSMSSLTTLSWRRLSADRQRWRHGT